MQLSGIDNCIVGGREEKKERGSREEARNNDSSLLSSGITPRLQPITCNPFAGTNLKGINSLSEL
jgi:hypothetical protein